MSGVNGDGLTPVVWGVSLERIVGCWRCTGLEVVASLPNLPTDLTGQRLLEGEAWLNWLQAQRLAIADLLDMPLAELDRITAGHVLPAQWGWVSAGVGALIPVFTGKPFLAAYAGIAGAMAFAVVRNLAIRRSADKVNPALRNFFERTLLEMQGKLRRPG